MKKMAKSVELRLFEGKWLTDPEILLVKHYEKKIAAQKKRAEEKLAERRMLAQFALPLSYYSFTDSSKKQNANAEKQETENSDIPTKPLSNEESEDAEHETNPVQTEVKPVQTVHSTALTRKRAELSYPVGETLESSAEAESEGPPAVDTRDVKQIDGSYKIKKRQKVDEEEGKPSGARSAPHGLLSHHDWNPRNGSLPREFVLPNFSYEGSQTVTIKLTTPPQSRRWSINISPAEHKDFCDILFHFNPRYGKADKDNCLIVNDMQGTWGECARYAATSKAFERMYNNSMELAINIRPNGFFVFSDGKFVVFFRHRREISTSNCHSLVLSFPVDDGMGRPEDVVIHEIWWGRRDPASLGVVPQSVLSLSEEEKDESWASQHLIPRTVELRGLPLVDDPKEVYELEKACYSLFEEYGIEAVVIVKGKGFGFARLSNEEQVQTAIRDLDGAEIRLKEEDETVTTMRLCVPGGDWLLPQETSTQ